VYYKSFVVVIYDRDDSTVVIYDHNDSTVVIYDHNYNTVVIYDHNDNTVVIYDHNDSRQYYKTMILAILSIARSVNYDCKVRCKLSNIYDRKL
jgi:hypothetical protein